MNKLRQGDEIIVISGRDKGSKGTILKRVNDEFLLIDGINLCKKHQKSNSVKGISGGIVSLSLPMHQSKVMVFNPTNNKPDRVRIKILSDNKKVRVYASTGDEIKLAGRAK
jgi:large subunit ribosomal protein L24